MATDSVKQEARAIAESAIELYTHTEINDLADRIAALVEKQVGEKDAEVVRAARALVDKLNVAVEHPTWKAVFQSAHVHGVTYTGPEFGEELKWLTHEVAAGGR